MRKALLVALLGWSLSSARPAVDTASPGTLPPTIIISEIMQNPSDVSDTNGEWFEVFNGSGGSVDLKDWVIKDDGSNRHTISSSVVLEPGDHAVLCRNTDPAANGGLVCDYAYSSFTLANSADQIVLCLADGVTEVDRVEYDGGPAWPDPDGASMVFTGTPGDDNNDPGNWTTALLREPSYPPGGADKGSPGTKGSDGNLPVELVGFDAVLDGDGVLLRWHTASETNNAGFEIQLSRFADAGPENEDGSWEALGFVVGAGATLEAQQYRYCVEDLEPGRHRFRLKQVDFDGTFAYSPEVEAAVAVKGAYHLSNVYPNPFQERVYFSLVVARAQAVEVDVYDLRGRRVASLYNGLMAAGTAHTFTFEAGGLPSGVYVLRVAGTHFATNETVVLAR